MSRDIVKDEESKISNTIVRTLLISLTAVIIKIFQLFLFYNETTGLLNKSFFCSLLGGTVVILILYISVEYVMLSLKVHRLVGYVNLTTQPLIGLALIFTAICFLFQGIFDFLTNLQTSSISLLALSIHILTIVTAVSYGLQGFEIVLKSRKPHFFLNMLPVVWSILVLMNVMLTYPNVVSMQSNLSKVICCALVLIFTYYTARWACSFETAFRSSVGLFFRISFSCLTLIYALPYGITFLFGKRDSIQNMPYLALIGLAVYGFLVLLQFMAQSLLILERKTKNKKFEK